ncbi:M10 family metallopeptidase C-terminal domain-containing protein [Falsiroseomonas sp. E2-1-a20]|uniref:M10 family metallopeptidase C-terminal domain-containing protein n=1 Tax=Falsiroseomonas sp. E2-1-a20 TaxID=3239300 RepID=UPI003F39882D
MTELVRLTEDYGYTSLRLTDLGAGSTVDARGATWIVDNSRNDNPTAGQQADEGSGPINLYPFRVDGAGQGLTILGGTFNGQVPQNSDWEDTYVNSAALRISHAPDATIQGTRVDGAWDALRVSDASPNFTINQAWVSNIRDDAFENDSGYSGTIKDSLFDGVFVGVSLGDGDKIDGSANTVTFDGVLMRSKAYLYQGEMTHGSPIKTNSGAFDTTPQLRFIDTVMAIDTPDHRGWTRLENAWENTVESRGNVFLNLSDTPLPSDYPKPTQGWTILEGQAARSYWEQARSEWISEHGDGSVTEPDDAAQPIPEEAAPADPVKSDPIESDPVEADPEEAAPADPDPVEPTPVTPAPVTTAPVTPAPVQPAPVQPAPADRATFSGTDFRGSSGDDLIIGNDLDNVIQGRNGNDTIKGGAGNDTIDAGNGADVVWGGEGRDTFVFARGGDMDGSSVVDIFMDFESGSDVFDLSLIDANERMSGDQAFAFIGTAAFKDGTPGQLRAAYDRAGNVTVVELNTDRDAAPEYWFKVAGQHDFSAADFIL